MSNYALLIGLLRFICISLALTAAVTMGLAGVLLGAFVLTLMTPPVNR
jgi:hypothetical protein